ncbi:PepSY domain-containing protein [Nesterenkonia suensis]
MRSTSRSSAALVAIAVSASLLAGCGSPDDTPDPPEAADEEGTLAPSHEPSAEHPHDVDDIDFTLDVALQAVNTAVDAEEGKAVAFDKTGADERGMSVEVLVGGEEIRIVVTDPEGTAESETHDGGAADEDLQARAAEADVPLLRAMQIARTESSGLVLSAQLEDRDGELIVWSITVEGPDSENTVIIDARNGAIVPEGPSPVEENNIGGDPDTMDDDTD